MDGAILIHKPKNLTSHDIVKQLRNVLNIKKVGHFGTLDPMATGLILVGTGKATRLFPFLSKLNKAYQGQARLGFSTDTYDATGRPSSPKTSVFPDKMILLAAMQKYEGDILQQPPPYSAKKYQGKPLYYLARKKQKFNAAPNRVHVYHCRLTDFTPPIFGFEVRCSSGTYIRSIAHDLGQDLGCGAHLSQLIRTEIGRYQLGDAFSLEEIQSRSKSQRWENCFIPIESLLPEFPKIILDETGTTSAKHGNPISPENIIKILPPEGVQSEAIYAQEVIFKLFSLEAQFIALAKRVPGERTLHPFLVLETNRKA